VTDQLTIKNIRDLADIAAVIGVPVHGAPALGVPLHTNGHLGADLLHVKAGDRFPVHVHPGDHLLLCLQGTGTITIGEVTYDVQPGDLYMVNGQVPHAVGAGDEDHVLVAIGAPHKPVTSPERMQLTNWAGEKVSRPLFAS
jgi:quercetin dioxygenase-like cupin family protein